jgi:hypothetical protein
VRGVIIEKKNYLLVDIHFSKILFRIILDESTVTVNFEKKNVVFDGFLEDILHKTKKLTKYDFPLSITIFLC